MIRVWGSHTHNPAWEAEVHERQELAKRSRARRRRRRRASGARKRGLGLQTPKTAASKPLVPKGGNEGKGGLGGRELVPPKEVPPEVKGS